MRVVLVNCATRRELMRTSIYSMMAPLGVLYLKAWLDMCRIDGLEMAFIDDKLFWKGQGVPTWPPEDIDKLEMILYWIRPATLMRSIEAATNARANDPNIRLIAIGPGAYGWSSRFTDRGPFNLIVEGGPYGVVERILRGEKIEGIVDGSAIVPPVRLPEAAARYPVGRLTTTWGAITATTFCVMPKMQNFGFRATEHVEAEIEMMLGSDRVRCIEFVDDVLFKHPGGRSIIRAFGEKKHWGAVVNCERKHGELARFPEAVDNGLGLLKIDALSRTNEVLRSIRRRSNRVEIDRTFKRALKLRKDGVEIIVRLVYGLPHQTWSDLLEDMDFFERNGVYLEVDPLLVHPGTWLWHHREQSGIVLDENNEVKSTRWMTEEEIKNVRLFDPTRTDRLNDVGPRVLVRSC